MQISKKINIDWRRVLKSVSFGAGPEADWKIIFLSTLVLSLVAVVLGGSLFLQIDKQEIYVSGDGLGRRSLNLEKLKKTSLYYDEKAREFQAFKSSGPRPSVDPAI